MKKFNVIVTCLVFSCFMFINMTSAQDVTLNINLSNVDKSIAKPSFLKPVNYTNKTSYYKLFNAQSNISLSSIETTSSIMLTPKNPALQNSKFFNFMSVLTSTDAGNPFRFSVGGVLASSLGNVLGLRGGIRGAGCPSYSNESFALNAYISNSPSPGTPILNTYYNGSTGNNNTSGQTRIIQRNQSSNFVRLGKQ